MDKTTTSQSLAAKVYIPPKGGVVFSITFLVCNFFSIGIAFPSDSKSIDGYLPGNRLLNRTHRMVYRELHEVKGRVTGENGEALPGVTIMIKGTQQGMITDSDGRFSMEVPHENDILIFSFVGYERKEITVGNKVQIDLVLSVDKKNLDEVIVVGYGSQSKKLLSTAISRVSGKEINNLPVIMPGDALAGLAAGVQIQAGGGDAPGTAPTIRIRGIGSLGASNNPLFIVDGYPLPTAAEFNRINVADIESIEVLKDAASASIYGSRAANGVVIVTTKRGQQGKVSFILNAFSGIQNVANRIEVMNKAEYLQYAKDARKASGLQVPDAYNQSENLPDTDWQNVIFRKAPMSKLELSARGGSERVRFSISGSYLNQIGTLVGTDYKVTSIRTNIDAELTKKLNVGANFAPSFSISNTKPTPRDPGNWGYNPTYLSMLVPPVVAVKLPNGDYGQNNVLPHTQYGFSEVGGFNPLAILELEHRKTTRFGLVNNMFLEWRPLSSLKLKSQWGAVIGSSAGDNYTPSTLASLTTPFANLSSPQLSGIASNASNTKELDWLWESNVTYNKSFQNNHNLTAMLLYSIQKYSSTATTTTGRVGSFTNDLVHNPTASSNQAGSITYGLNSFLSYVARINYDFKNKYIFSGSVRADGSSKFGSNNKFGIFQSYSVAWRVSEESFWKQQSFFNELKLRASYGETGNANIGDFTWVSGMTATNYNFGETRYPGASASGFMNRDLTWEKSKQLNLGLETSFLQNRIGLTVDVYQKQTKGMLFAKDLPALVGYATSFQTNIGSLQNKGIELDLTTNNLNRKLKWNTALNVSYNTTKVLDLGGRQSLNSLPGTPGWSNVYKIEVGEPLGKFYGFVIDGVIKNESQLKSSPQWTGSGVGDYQIKDVNKDGVIDEGDRTFLGNGFPKVIIGMTNTFTFSGIDLSFILQGVAGNQIINGASRHSELWVGRWNAVKEMANNYFDPANPDRDVKYARVGTVRSGFGTASNLHSYAVYNGSFVRFRNITLGYTIPLDLQKKLHLNSLRVYVTSQNLLTFTKYPGLNPEPSQYGETVYQPGSDQATYPVNRSIMLGFNVSF